MKKIVLKLLQNVEITRTIYLNSERSVEYLKENAVSTYPWRFLRSITLEQVEFKLEKIIGIKCSKSCKSIVSR